MNTTPDLFTRLAESAANLSDVTLLCGFLLGRDWTKAVDIERHYPDWNDRKIRAIASESQGRIVSGPKGYKLTTACTPEEVRLCTARMVSQAKQMEQRAIDIGHVFHKAVH